MPSILAIPWSDRNVYKQKLPKVGLIVDPRPMTYREDDVKDMKFQCIAEGVTLTIRRIDLDGDKVTGWGTVLRFRVYDPSIETVPNFTSKSYMYHGLEGETAPFDAEEVIIDPSVTVLGEEVFKNHRRMKRCIMGDNVVRIEDRVFEGCTSLRNIRLSRGLQYIGPYAFWYCSFHCLFIPPNVDFIEMWAFYCCVSLKVLVLPSRIHPKCIGNSVIRDCTGLLTDSMAQYEFEHDILNGHFDEEKLTPVNNVHVNQWLIHRYDHLPIVRLCADPDVTGEAIRDFHRTYGTDPFYHQKSHDMHGLTPLHILTQNACHTSDDAIVACYGANPSALLSPDVSGMTPLHHLWDHDKVDIIVHLMRDLCINRCKYVNGGIVSSCGSRDGKRKRDM